ncbi:DegT/DnrJ/EryC1/StrS family aminotransferase [Cryobacterium sp. Sr8]|uniref:DegT/DnrJ/EryC1/StrS family aminotransferase n=1 Tax=Cryobacterium sp. Sr8 TaxID=1259203 RepID=UPI00106CD729|nr:DegT/DnrJ/EryC1/StrS family aminotransferase [Cryobacterium sp. Sr8]TFD79127.1 DegT/DnrJ/EryC1/StrS family aminotransferase [Cryobacterium sp. Sr8]
MNTAIVRRSIPMNDLARGISRDREILTAAFESVLSSGHVVMGPNHSAFQRELGDYLGVAHVLGVASGTDALELAIKAVMPLGRSTVITAANAGGYTSTAAKRAGYRVRYADVDANSLCLSSRSVEAELSPDVGVVVVTHLYGNLTDTTELVELCHTRGVRVVEDCAQAIGARLDGGSAGSFGDIAATSFYPTKNLGAIGDGGAIATNSDEYASAVSQLRQYGWSSKYHVAVAGGTNSRLDELQAAFLRARLPLLDAFNERRRQIVARYVAAAVGGPLRVLSAEGPHHVAHLAVALSPRREEMRAALRDLGVQTDVHFPVPDHWQPGFGSDPQVLPVTELVAGELFSLPCFPELTDDEVQFVCTAIGSLA